MTLNVKGRNIEINDTLAAAYKEAVFLDMAEIDALAFLSEEWNTNHPENRFYEFSDDELSKIIGEIFIILKKIEKNIISSPIIIR